MRTVAVGKALQLGNGRPLALIAGPCVIEDERTTLLIAERLKAAAARLRMPLIFKASFDKANRSSASSFRGPGLERGLAVLAAVKRRTGLPVLTDIHEPAQAAVVAAVADILQIPAFLCRQTDLLVAAARTGLPVNIKKGQFLAPEDLLPAVAKVTGAGNPRVVLTERGTSFGYHDLVVDMRSIAALRRTGHPIVFDATHAVQQPGGLGTATGGKREFIAPLAAAAVALGIAAVFLETHPAPARALSDGPNSVRLADVPALLARLQRIDRAAKEGVIP